MTWYMYMCRVVMHPTQCSKSVSHYITLSVSFTSCSPIPYHARIHLSCL